MYGGYIFAAGLLTTTSALLGPLYSQLNNNCSDVGSFMCKNSRCIPTSKICDGNNDCFDFSDEVNCDEYHCKDINLFKCKNGRCIPKSFLCDRQNDCEDFSDEDTCDNFKYSVSHPTNCSVGEWKCTDNLCIPEEFVCNGEKDCLDGSDEIVGCYQNKSCKEFQCHNGHCIPQLWRCDGSNDCLDESDELNCTLQVPPEHCTFDQRMFLCADKKTCLKLAQACNDKNECPDGSDEGPMCKTKTCATHECSHDCIQLPTGPKCVCPKGYNTINEKLCEDINECEEFGICDQKCRNKRGSYECYCDPKYQLQDDEKTCRVRGGEPLMMFSTKQEIRGYFMESKVYFEVARDLKHVVGVAFNGDHVYWTDVSLEHETIVRAMEDGSQREIIVTSGLGVPEDLAIDWITGNIYFTDSEMHFIGVCTYDGEHCTVLINTDIDKPRGVVLHSDEGQMFWSDWGKSCGIYRADMDGLKYMTFVGDKIEWPNGLAIDYPNDRLYWTDAKYLTLESIRLDGTDRRVVLEGVVKHPYAVAVFENQLYWSDWYTLSIQVCDKFTGKNRHTIIKEKDYVYGIHIYHSALKSKRDNPCSRALCSDICLLKGMKNYTCSCPQNKVLGSDQRTCKIAVKGLLMKIEHKLLGKHEATVIPVDARNIRAVAFCSTNNTAYISDTETNTISEVSLDNGHTKTIFKNDPKSLIESLAYDYMGNNLYWCDIGKATLEILNLNTMSIKILIHSVAEHVPTSLALVPEEGVMFVCFKSSSIEYHIDRMYMDGTSRTHVIEEGLFGPITLHYNSDLHRIFWADAGTGNIESTSMEGDDRHGFRSLTRNPISLTSLGNDTFWTVRRSRTLYWAHKINEKSNKKLVLDTPSKYDTMYIASGTKHSIPSHPCRLNNGNCSHLCLLSSKKMLCSCPLGMELNSDQRTCSKPLTCKTHEFLCKGSRMCIPSSMLCNGYSDCHLGEDEATCDARTHCLSGFFRCRSGECIKESLVCNLNFDCKDKSDETSCNEDTYQHRCPVGNFKCPSGKCIESRSLCDGKRDCEDGSDEQNCALNECESNEFRCTTGSCIPKNWECDREFDCTDSSDEHEGCSQITCSPAQFTCENGKCIDAKLVCDLNDDCSDKSDELHCEKLDENVCSEEEFQCTSSKSQCLPKVARCNGTYECPNREDEENCLCFGDDFECDNGKCLPQQWVCDGSRDCFDGTDEGQILCKNRTSSSGYATHTTPCTHGYRCKNGYCLDLYMVCNGVQDCDDGSDEGGLCEEACSAKNNPCSQKCVKTPNGSTCSCNEGYELMLDGQSCIDVKECSKDPPVCSQICSEMPGSFICSCFDGYILRNDKKSCKNKGSPLSIIFTTNNEIRKLSMEDNSLMVLWNGYNPRMTGLDASISHKLLYFSVKEEGFLYQFDMNNMKEKSLIDLDRPGKLVTDWTNGNVYVTAWTNNTMVVNVCNFERILCIEILRTSVHRHISAIAIDVINKFLFYSTTLYATLDVSSSDIRRVNLDGSGDVVLESFISGEISGMTCDEQRRILYHVDQHRNVIREISYEGNHKRDIFANLTRPRGLRLFEDHLYFLTNGGFISKCNLFGEKRACHNFKLNSFGVNLFTLHQKSYNIPLRNVCEKSKCPGICVPSVLDWNCLCPNGDIFVEGTSCNNSQVTNYVRNLADVNSKEPKLPMPAYVEAFLIIFILLIVFGIMTMYFLRCRNVGTFNIHSGIRFVNPIFGRISPNSEDEAIVIQPGQHEYNNPVNFPTREMEQVAEELVQRVALPPLIEIDENTK